MNVLVTGGTGFIGPHVVRALRESGHRVRVLEHRPGSAVATGADAVAGSMTDPESLRRAVEGQEVVVHLVARLEGKSSLGRLGLLIHSTAGFIDPGWDGHVTLELSNVANLPITIYRGMKIGQLSFVQLTEAAEKPYGTGGLGSKYQGQQGPTPSRYWKNFQA